MITRYSSKYSRSCFARFAAALTGMTCVLGLETPTLRAGEDDDVTAVDAKLLEDLGADLFDEPASGPVGLTSRPQAGDRELDQELMEKLVQPEGEDVGARQGAARPQDWLKHVKEQMAKAESMLAARDASGRASATQQEVVNELDAMIAKLQTQCENCGGQCNKPPSPSNKPPKPGGKSGAKPGETATVAATAAAAPADRAAIGNLVKDLWGRLPERQREELLQPLSEEFLPEYAPEIEEYFRVLAETTGERESAEKRP
jgi:hypothetical protein